MFPLMFANREEAGWMLVTRLRDRVEIHPSAEPPQVRFNLEPEEPPAGSTPG
jgi:hypothetical protein